MGNFVDLNCDLGESYGSFKVGQDDDVMKCITSANIACGYHAGDHNVIQKTIKKAVENGVGLGAHPGFLDLHGFGRREINLDMDELYNLIIYQIGAVQAFAKVNNSKLNHVKPHGALYNMAGKDQQMAETIAQAVYDVNPELILFGLAGSELIRMGKKAGLQVAEEVFADRTYQPDGTLTSRSLANAMITDSDEAVARVIRMVRDGKVEAVDGSDIPIHADTICVHGDSEKSLEFVKKLNRELMNNGIILKRVGM
ncbi:5-oxoprolinase subunit PxpA [Oceanobacillus sp. Castelsardo]|uniref:5-oxoprolinase subunit PxpA n=1 Tax=Oceanobacillus sp. Castelsardo TaxID=1851204 RepID=UPI000838CF45|nr:5-oxoprolinase subunit PxpA [Oceanobacillus sp. Castelsardo]